MSTQFSLHKSRFDPSSLTGGAGPSKSASDTGESDVLDRTIASLSAELQHEKFDRGSFLNQIADEARHLTHADSAVVALRELGTIVCLARSGPIGPTLGSPLDNRSGMSGECLRQGLALRCEDSELDSRVDAEVCRRLAIRSLVVVPVFERSEVVGLLEAFSPRPNAFQDRHVLVLEKLASLVTECRTRAARALLLQSQFPPPSRPKQERPLVSAKAPGEAWQSKLAEAFDLRPYQIAVVIGFLLLDLATIYWWHQR